MKLKRTFKKPVGLLLVFSFFLQSAAPLIAATRSSTPPRPAPTRSVARPTILTNTIVDTNLNALIKHIVNEAVEAKVSENISQPLQQCYRLLTEGKLALPVEDVWQAMPEILRYAVEQHHTKAVRPDAPKLSAGIATAGSDTSCDLSKVLDLLSTIKNRIGCVEDDVCCDTILGILGDACEKFGPDSNISCEIVKLCEKILENRKIICEKFEQTWTILADIKETLTECCEEIKDDIFNTQTILCNKFEQTWTILADIKETLTECCEEIKDDIFDTQTIICKKISDLCFPIPLRQGDASEGQIVLTEKGTYQFCENIEADLVICNTCISVDMNDRKLFGTVCIKGDDVILKDGYIQPAAPTTPQQAATPAVDVKDCVVNTRLLNLTITNADSTGHDGVNGLNGRDGIRNEGIKTFILDCCIQTGAGANGINADGQPSVVSGAGGNGGCGINSLKDKAQIGRTIVMTGNGGNGGDSCIGNVDAGDAGDSGAGIKICGDLSCVFETKVFTGNGGNGGNSPSCEDGGDGGKSGDGICNKSQSTEMRDSTFRTGNGGNGGVGDNGNDGGKGGSSGHAIKTQGTQITRVVLSTGNAGNGGNAGTGGAGGNAGHGLFVWNACETEAREIVVERTGVGGSGGNSSAPTKDGGAGGNGGHAVNITKDSHHTEVRLSTFSNTGRGGSGGSPGLAALPGADGNPGRAVTDLNCDECSLDPACATNQGPSAIFANFAYGIGDTEIRYLINGKVQEAGRSSDKSCNRLDNVYVECNVDKVFDVCQEIIDTRTILCNKFEQTWTILADIKETLTECCEEIQDDILDTQTVLCDKFNQTFTVLEELQESLDECCDEIKDDIFDTQTILCDKFNQTFTVLKELQESLDECCDEIKDDIFDTQTIICDKFNQTFTVLEELQESLDECCEEIKDDIFDTQTIICKKIQDLCFPIPIYQADASEGQIVLTEKGTYQFCENITADLVICNTCISVDMNDRKLFGTVCIKGDDVVLKDGYIQPAAPTTPQQAATPAVDVKDCVVNARLLNLTITNADSTGHDGANGLNGRDGIRNEGIKTFILDCCIQTGAGANGINADGQPSVVSGNGGDGGCGINSLKDKAQIGRTIVMTGNGGNGGDSCVGGEDAGDAGDSGAGIKICGNLSCVFETKVFTGNGGNGGNSPSCEDGGDGGNSGDGICNKSESTEISDCTCRTGNAGSGGVGDNGNNGGAGGNSGNAIKTQGTQITRVVLSTGNAGNGGNAGTGGAGGNAGHGLFVWDACETEAREIVVERTGIGGNGGNSSVAMTAGGAGGNGGHAVNITKGSHHTEVRLSTFSNTGRGGTGGTPGAEGSAGADGNPGRAVTDLNCDECSLDPACTTNQGPSAIFANFAYGIGDTQIRYLINGKVQEAGRSSDKSCNRLDNVYVECNVDVVFDVCQEIIDTRTILCNKFEQTWTILADIKETLTECCEEIQDDIFNTQTILCEKVDRGFNETFTVLEELQESLDECCDEIKDDIFDTQTILCDKFNQTFTVLEELQESLDECCDEIMDDIFDTQTILCDKFNQTFTVLEELQESLDECCEEIKDDIFDTQTIICKKIQDLCFPIPIYQADASQGQIVLTEKGSYQFCENITADLVICNTCISVDMNDRKLFGTVCIKGDDVILKDGYIQPAGPTTPQQAATPAVDVKDCVVNARLLNLTITCADSTEHDGVNGLNGRDGIRNEGIKTFILDCCIQTGAGADGVEADGAQSTEAGNGGNGGCGINSLKDKAQIGRTIVMTGNGGNGGDSCVGGEDAGDAGDSGAGIKVCGNLSCVFETKVFTGNGGNGGNSPSCEDGGDGGNSGDGICNKSESTEISDCTCRTGNAGSGGVGDNGNNGGAGGDSGNAIKTQGTQITRVVLSTGNAGNGGDAGTGGAGGNAGHGLFVWNACETEAREIVVERTGVGGNGGNSSAQATAGGNGGNGGDAVQITQDSRHTEVRLSTFSNTGTGGAGGTGTSTDGADGNPGRAVRDLNTDLCSLDPACTTTQGPSVIFANFAYGIGDTEIRYSINGKEQEAGRSSDKSCNRLDNVYVECNVDVVFDICQELIDTRTILCNKFEQTWTVLADIKETLTECCEEIQEDILDTRTILCEKVERGFNETFTAIKENTEIVCDKFDQTFTVLEELQETLDECCNEIMDDIFDTQTIICDKFNQTWTILADIKETLTECCEEIQNDIFDTQTILCKKFDDLCTPIPLRQGDVDNGVLELTEKGNYIFCENITADLVVCNTCISVDMNDRKLFGTVCIKGDDVILKDGYIQPAAPTTPQEAATPAVEVKDCVVNARLLNLTITNADSTEVDGNNNGLNGRDGIVNNGIKTFILDCCIQTGAGAPGGEADAEQSTPAGDGGDGGCGINSLKDKAQIGRTIIMTGNGGNGGSTECGGEGLENAGNAGSSGVGIKVVGDLSCVFETKVFTGNGGMGGTSTCGDGGNGGDSGDGICNNSESTEISDCTCRTGNAGSGGNGDNSPTDEGGNGGNSGHAIKTQGTQITRVVLSTGNAGSGGNGGIGGTGGNAGHGLFVNDACETEAREIVVERTGVGGDGGTSTAPAIAGGAGGNGGDAVNITKDSHHTEVRLSTFSNTGRGGTGGTNGGGPDGTDGNPGRAVTDLNCDECSLDPACTTTFQGPSAIFANFAYGIGNTSIRYLINGKVQEAGRSSDKSCNRLDNVYVECNVDVVFDICQELIDTRTILCNKFEQTWTVLADIKETLTECCEEIQNDIFDTQTILCEKVDRGFNETFTAIKENTEIVCDKFDQTWTILDNICEKIEDIPEQIDLQLDDEFAEVFTAIKENTEIVCDKFEETWTVLADIKETLTECCEEIQNDIFDTQTILCQKFDDLCTPIPLRQEDSSEGQIVLTEKGSYIFCENLTADLVICNTCISVDMNDRKLFGTVCIKGDDVILRDGYIQTLAPTTTQEAATPAVEVKDCVVNARLLNLTITNADSTEVDGNNNGLNGRDGILNNGIKTFILDCCIQTGAGAPGGDADVAQIIPAGDGGNGGCGINSLKDKAQIGRTIVMTGNGGNGGGTDCGEGLETAGNAGNSGTGIKVVGDLSCVFETKVFTGNGGDGGESACGNGGNGGDSGDGICNNSESTEISDCTCRTGNAGSGGNGDTSPTDEGGNGGNSGHAIKTQGTQITRVVLSTGNAGSGGNGGIGGTGGNAGHGLFVNDACETEAREIVVERTGNGGDGGNSGPTSGGAAGNGGDAVHITQDSHHTEVRLSTFSNTGSGGTGGTGMIVGADGNPGRAVRDLNTDLCSLDPACTTTQGPSVIFSNFAYGIGDTNIRYSINGKEQEAGRSSDKSCNRLDNVYVECNVDVVFDICQELIDTRTILCNKFEQTWTVLADIKETLTECCEEIQNDIFDTQTILCEKIDRGFNETFTAIKENTEIVCDKFDQTWTVLADIKETLTECCEEIQNDILDTQTILCEKIDRGFNETFTAIIENTEVVCDKFDQTWTVLDNICNKIDAIPSEIDLQLDDEFAEVFTAIKENTEIVCDKFEQTWTTIEDVKVTTINNFNETFTVLDNIKDCIGELDLTSTPTEAVDTVMEIDDANLTVIEWLKTIMRKLNTLT